MIPVLQSGGFTRLNRFQEREGTLSHRYQGAAEKGY